MRFCTFCWPMMVAPRPASANWFENKDPTTRCLLTNLHRDVAAVPDEHVDVGLDVLHVNVAVLRIRTNGAKNTTAQPRAANVEAGALMLWLEGIS
jgi:hypothetical protein